MGIFDIDENIEKVKPARELKFKNLFERLRDGSQMVEEEVFDVNGKEIRMIYTDRTEELLREGRTYRDLRRHFEVEFIIDGVRYFATAMDNVSPFDNVDLFFYGLRFSFDLDIVEMWYDTDYPLFHTFFIDFLELTEKEINQLLSGELPF